MKKYFSIAVLCALAVLGLGSCAKDVEEEIVTEQTGVRTVTFSASLADQTKTGLSMKFVPNWINTSLENVHLFETCGSEVLEGVDVEMRVPEDRNNEVAYFKADFAEEISIIVNPPSSPTSVVTRASEEYTYTGIVAQKVDGKFTVPATQYPDPVSLIDPNADFLVGDTKTTFSESMALKEMDIYFVRPVSVSRLAIMNIEGQKVKTVKITADNGVKLTGSAAYSDVNFSAGTVAWDNSGSNVITISYGDGKDIPAEATFYAYFISLPGSKKIMSVEVTTDQYVYTKSFTSGKTLVFNTTEFKNIAVDMSKVTPTPVGPATPVDQEITFHKNNGVITADSFTLGSGTYALPTLDGVAEGATVTWTLTDSNPAGVATIAQTGGVWTLTPVKAGTVKVNATASAVTGYNQTTVSYTLTVSDAGTQTLVFTPTSLTVTLGDTDFTVPALTGNKTAVTYSIDPEGVATIDATNGKLTLVAAGTATVTATAAAGLGSDNVWYAEATKTYALTVNNPVSDLVTINLEEATELVAGEKYVLVSNGFALVRNGENASAAAFDATAMTVAVPADLQENLEWTLEKKSGSITRGNEYVFTQGTYFFGIAMNTNQTTYTYTVEVNNGRQVATNVSIQDHNISLANDLIYYAGNSSNYYVFYNTADSKWDNEKIGNTATPATTSKTALYKLKDMRAEQNPTFSNDEAEYDLNGSTWTKPVPTLQNAQGTVTYESSDTDVATVDRTSGAVTIVSTAKNSDTVVITANAAGNETYKPGSASYTISIVDSTPPAPETTYNFVSGNLSEGTYLIVGDDLNATPSTTVALFPRTVTKDWGGSSPATNGICVIQKEITLDGTNPITTTDAEIVGAEVELIASNSGWKVKAKDGKYLKSPASSSDANHVYFVDAEADASVFTAGSVTSSNNSANGRSFTVSGSSLYLFHSGSASGFTIRGGTTVSNLRFYKKAKKTQSISFDGTSAEYDLIDGGKWVTAVPDLDRSGAETTVTFASSNTAVAEVNTTSGAVTIPSTAKPGDTAKITATAEETDEYEKATAEYTIQIIDSTPVAQVLTFNPASLTGQVGATVTPPTISGAHTAVTYSSEYPNVATVDANTGALSLLEEGTTTITAVAAAGTGTDGVNYAQGTGSYILTVTAATPPSGGKTYTRISGQSELVTGTYLVVSVNNTNKVLKGGTGDGADRGAVVDATTAPMSMSGNTITISDESVCDVYEYVITRTENSITLKGKLGYLKHDRPSNGGNSTTYIGFEDAVSASSTFVVNTNPGSHISGADAVFFSVSNNTGEYLYYNTSGYYKLGGSGAPSSSKYGGVFLYKLNDGGTTPEPPTPTTQYYTKVSNTSALPTTTDAASGNYLIVYEDGEKAYVFKPICGQDPTGSGTESEGHTELTKAGSAIEVALTSEGIAATSAIEDCKIQMKKKDGSSSWYLYSPGISWWLRINSSNGTLVAMTSSGYGCSFSFSGTGNNLSISRRDSRTAYMRYSASNTYFEATTSSSTSHALSLYKLSE